jgi:hypothetical protein
MEEYERKNKRRTPNSPRPRSKWIPSQRGDFDWWKCGSRSPLSFPSKRCKIHWREREIASSKRVKNGGKNKLYRIGNFGEEDPFI